MTALAALPPPEPIRQTCPACDYTREVVPIPAQISATERVWLVPAPQCPDCGDPRFGA